MYTLNDLVVDEGNARAIRETLDIIEEVTAKKLFIHGAPKSGKTHLLHAAQEKAGNNGVYCATTDFMIRLDLDTDDAFFERIGSAPVLYVDVFERLFTHDLAPELMRLLLLERERLGLATVVASRLPLNSFPMDDGLAEAFSAFQEIAMEPLGLEGRLEAVELFAKRYGTENGPTLTEDAASFLAKTFTVVSELENAVHFLRSGAGLSPESVVDTERALSLFERQR